jgi:hypothetical protein
MKPTSAAGVFVKIPWYAPLFGVYPVLALYAHNVTEVQSTYLWRPLLVSLGGVLAFTLLFRLFLKNWHLAAITASILVIMFFAYGHVYSGLKSIPFAIPLARHRLLLPAWVLLTCLGIWLTIRRTKKPERIAPILNVVALLAVAFPLVQVGTYFIHLGRSQAELPKHGFPGLKLLAGQPAPDIYYIILDAYGNTDTLNKLMDYDDTGFLDALRAQGFFVADCSQANYGSTQLSLVSSLNLNYLSAFGDDFLPGSHDSSHQSPYIKWSATRYTLEDLGYQTIAFETGFSWTEWYDADLYFKPGQTTWSGWNEFEDLLVKTSALRALYDLNIARNPVGSTSPHYDRVRYVLDSLKVLPTMPGPKFVFVHLLMPHPPFDFGTDGQYEESWSSTDRVSYFEGYRRQAVYISKVIPEVTAAIIAHSATPPIILLQGDHGPGFAYDKAQHLGILNAYYIPQGSRALYDTITPVNTFRVIFNTYFGGNFHLLDDISYRSASSQDPYTVTEVPNACKK